ncbi:hypothetical protein PInf_015567 [Phytophthora infestans]|nr:hypothetical protein PInf_015567 [Phytophthora infestans]
MLGYIGSHQNGNNESGVGINDAWREDDAFAVSRNDKISAYEDSTHDYEPNDIPSPPMEQAAMDSADGAQRQARDDEADEANEEKEAHDDEDDVQQEPAAKQGTAADN